MQRDHAWAHWGLDAVRKIKQKVARLLTLLLSLDSATGSGLTGGLLLRHFGKFCWLTGLGQSSLTSSKLSPIEPCTAMGWGIEIFR